MSRSSVLLAAALLEDMGFKVIEAPRQIVVDGVRISDIDIVAERGGVLYAVEVKAGAADVSSVRQAYVNAKLVGYKPMIIARGADDAALLAARELGVDIITLPDMLVAGPDEIREIVEESVYDALIRIVGVISACGELDERDRETLQAIVESETIADLAEKLGVSINDAARIIASVRKRLGMGAASFKTIRSLAGVALLACGGRRT